MGVYRLGEWIQRYSGLVYLSMVCLLRPFPELSFMTTWAVA